MKDVIRQTEIGGREPGCVTTIFIDTLEPTKWRVVNTATGEVWRTEGKKRKLVKANDVPENLTPENKRKLDAFPDLLEACEELLQMCEKGVCSPRKEARIIDKAEKAVAKAKGME